MRAADLSIGAIHARCVSEGDCLLWTGYTTTWGTPRCDQRSLRDVVYEQANQGKVVSRRGKYLVTTCGNKECLEPTHLSWRTRSQHFAALAKQGVFSRPDALLKITASKRAAAKFLTMEKAREIRRSEKTQKELSAEYGVSVHMIRKVQKQLAWAERPASIPARSIFDLGSTA